MLIVNPGGTGSPIEAISARLAPLPPRSSRMLASPSVLLPKANTYFLPVRVLLPGEDFFVAVLLMIPCFTLGLLPQLTSERHYLCPGCYRP